jgi:DMSO/TMAO reductase YedYZ molybdopterin-dependent catalytic subunit
MIQRKRAMSRRKFIKITGTTLALSGLPMAARMARAEGVSPPANLGGITPIADFYITSYAKTPGVDVTKWRLRIHGLVDKPLTFTYDDIKRLPAVKQILTLECIGNPPSGNAIGNAEWTGVMLKPLLERAGVKRNAVYAAMRGADGYYTGVPVGEIMNENNWMPYLMNGMPLPPAHGYPLRVFIPGKYGMKQPKWLTEIEFVDHEFLGYWEEKGWSNEAWRKVNSGFLNPRPNPDSGIIAKLSNRNRRVGQIFDVLGLSEGVRVKAPLNISGWALAGPSGIKRVQVSTDDGATWREAQMLENKSPYVWTVWNYRFAPTLPGEYTVRVRATDGAGTMQPEYDPDSHYWKPGQPQIGLKVISVA